MMMTKGEAYTMTITIHGKMVKIWKKVRDMPDYVNNQDLFRAMCRYFFRAKGYIPKEKGENVGKNIEEKTA